MSVALFASTEILRITSFADSAVADSTSVRSSAKIRAGFADSEPGDSARPGNEPVEADSEVQWLRERSLGHLYEAEAPVWRGWKYVFALVVIALGGLGICAMGHDSSGKDRCFLAAPATVLGAAARASRVSPVGFTFRCVLGNAFTEPAESEYTCICFFFRKIHCGTAERSRRRHRSC